MKPNRKSKIIFLIILGILFAFSAIIPNNRNFNLRNKNKSPDYCDDFTFDKDNLKNSAVSEKIHIINNSGWVDFKNAGNCTGNGTYSEPYIIKNLVIDSGDLGSGIFIENSNVYFKVENCTLYNSGWWWPEYVSAGIKLLGVSNGTLINNNVSNYNNYGIVLYNSNNNTISGNTANKNKCGIRLEDSDNNIISGNTANYNECGIFLEVSNNNTISGNSLTGNGECIVEDYHSDGNVIEKNYCLTGNELIILISLISAGTVISVATILLIRRTLKGKLKISHISIR